MKPNPTKLKRVHKKLGFTLIELLVVIAIIGVLSSIVLASLGSARKKAQSAKLVSDLKALQNAIYLYKDDNPYLYGASLPVNGPMIKWEDVSGSTELEDNLTAKLVTGGYIPEIPHFTGWPTDDVEVHVAFNTNLYGSYDIGYVCVEDGEAATFDDILNSGYEGVIMVNVNDSDITIPNSNSSEYCYYIAESATGGCNPGGSEGVTAEYCLPF